MSRYPVVTVTASNGGGSKALDCTLTLELTQGTNMPAQKMPTEGLTMLVSTA